MLTLKLVFECPEVSESILTDVFECLVHENEMIKQKVQEVRCQPGLVKVLMEFSINDDIKSAVNYVWRVAKVRLKRLGCDLKFYVGSVDSPALLYQ